MEKKIVVAEDCKFENGQGLVREQEKDAPMEASECMYVVQEQGEEVEDEVGT